MASRRSSITVIIGSVALIALAVSATAPALATDQTHPNYQASQNANASATLDNTIVRVERGETTDIGITLQGTSEATVILGGESSDFNVTVSVTDGNDDGQVQLEFRTGSVGMDGTRFVSADESAEYSTLNAAPNPNELVPVGDYPVSVYAGHGVSGQPTDVGTLVVDEQRPLPNATIERPQSTLMLHAQSNQNIVGTAELSEGRDITVRLRSSGTSPFLRTQTVAVGEDGSFEATFDLSNVEPPANATVTVYVDGERITGPVDAEVMAEGMASERTTGGTETTSAPGQPGFGVIVALFAVLGALILVTYRASG